MLAVIILLLIVGGNNNTVDNVTIGDSNGTGINVVGNDTKISDVNLNNNNGTGMVVSGDNNSISNATFANITSPNGALVINGTNTHVSNSTFAGNNATNGGGDIAITDNANMTQEDVDKLASENDVSPEGISQIPEMRFDTEISISVPPVVNYGDELVVVVKVTSGSDDPFTGNITLTIGKETQTAGVDKDGNAIFKFNLPAGEYEIVASYSGDNSSAAASTTKPLTVNKVPSDFTINATDVIVGQMTEITVNMGNLETGIVQIAIDGAVYNATIVDGVAKIWVYLPIGDDWQATVTYLGDNNYFSSSKVSDFIEVSPRIGTIIEVDPSFTRVANDYFAGERGAFFYAVLKDTNGNILVNKTVQIAINGPIYTVTTDAQGRAGLQVNLAYANTYTYALFFAGDDQYQGSSLASSKLTVTKKKTSITASNKKFKKSAIC